jgi:hypothetical protein
LASRKLEQPASNPCLILYRSGSSPESFRPPKKTRNQTQQNDGTRTKNNKKRVPQRKKSDSPKQKREMSTEQPSVPQASNQRLYRKLAKTITKMMMSLNAAREEPESARTGNTTADKKKSKEYRLDAAMVDETQQKDGETKEEIDPIQDAHLKSSKEDCSKSDDESSSIVSDEDYEDDCENGGKDVWGKLLDAGAFLDESVSKVDDDEKPLSQRIDKEFSKEARRHAPVKRRKKRFSSSG